ncbi:MAG: hypothetical protein JRI68_20820 [Deltaproteobacteria bacterium]|nr:hypothetical protein [Deltaproteobacteria bacterium]
MRGLSCIVGVVLAAGCNAMLDFDGIEYGTGGGTSSGSGGGAPCDTPGDCVGADQTCRYRICESGYCGMENAPPKTPCDDGDGIVCDGEGNCVECVDTADCDTGACQDHECVPINCINGVKDGDETDVDCGGSCAPCDDGDDCLTATDCVSLFCDGGHCAPCADDDDCAEAPNTYCEGGLCVPDKLDGEACDDDDQCSSGFCADGVCCDAACAGDCVACDLSGAIGTCTPHPAGTDPEGDCSGGLCDGAGSCATGGHLWSHHYGTASDQRGYDVAVDGQDRVIVTGEFFGGINFGGGSLNSSGSRDIFLAAFMPSGTHDWSSRFGGSLNQHGRAVAVDSADAIPATGHFQGTVDFGGSTFDAGGDHNIYLARFGSSGNHLFSQQFGDGSHQYGYDVAIDGQDNMIVVGELHGDTNFGGGVLPDGGSGDAFVAKFDSAGTHLWSQRYGDGSDQQAHGVATDAAGNVYLTGFFDGDINFGGATMDDDGGRDMFIAKLDAAGNHQWSKQYGDGQEQEGRAIAVDGTGNVVVTGRFRGAIDFGGGGLNSAGGWDVFAVKLDSSGNQLWAQAYGDALDQEGWGLAIDPADNVLLTGAFRFGINFGGGALSWSGGGDVYLAKLSAGGAHLWSKRFGDAADQVGQSVVADSAGNAILTGYFMSNIDFGGGSLGSAGSYDVFLAKFGP